MGLMTLADFRGELSAVTGGRANIGDPRIDLWINFGYFDVTGAVEFDELEDELEVTTTSSVDSVNLPSTVRSVYGVRGPSGLLQWVTKHEWMRLFGAASAEPTKWTRIGNEIKLSPTPNALYSLIAFTKVDADKLEADTDVTVLPRTWDMAVHYLAVSHAYYAMEEVATGANWLNRAIAYIQTRASEENRQLIEPGLGGTLAPSLERLAGPMAPANAYGG